MRKLERNIPVPPILTKTYRGKTELDRAAAFYASEEGNTRNSKGKLPSFDFSKYGEEKVKRSCDKLTSYKCAYCESPYGPTQPLDVEHYRPKAEVDGVADHRGYWWLAADWDNLLPSCIDCNRSRYQKLDQVADLGGKSIPELIKLREKTAKSAIWSARTPCFRCAVARTILGLGKTGMRATMSNPCYLTRFAMTLKALSPLMSTAIRLIEVWPKSWIQTRKMLTEPACPFHLWTQPKPLGQSATAAS